jgi:hypothetical protein
LELAGKQWEIRGWDASKAGGRQRDDVSGTRSNVDIFPVMPAKKGDHLSLETPPTPVCICRNLVAEPGWETDGASDYGFLRVGNG